MSCCAARFPLGRKRAPIQFCYTSPEIKGSDRPVDSIRMPRAMKLKLCQPQQSGRVPPIGYAGWRPKQRVHKALINTLLQRGVIWRLDVLNRFSGFHRPKPLKRLKFSGLACTQLKQGVNETFRSRCPKSGMRAARSKANFGV